MFGYRDNRGTRRQRGNSRSSFHNGSTSSLERCGATKALQRMVVLTLFSLSFSGEGGARFHYEVDLKALTKHLHKVGALLHNLIGDSQQTPNLLATRWKLQALTV